MPNTIIAIDNTGQKHITFKGNGSKYCRDNKINLDWCNPDSAEGKVLEGGVYFHCTECKVSGAISNSEFTQDIKCKAGVEASAPLGIKFYNCDEHEGNNEDK